jgi:hypothetical protein
MSVMHIMNKIAAMAMKISYFTLINPYRTCQANRARYRKKAPVKMVRRIRTAKDR